MSPPELTRKRSLRGSEGAVVLALPAVLDEAVARRLKLRLLELGREHRLRSQARLAQLPADTPCSVRLSLSGEPVWDSVPHP